jgi:hypothetical protein
VIQSRAYPESSLTVVDDEIGGVKYGVKTKLPNLCDKTALNASNPPVSHIKSSTVLVHVSDDLYTHQSVIAASLPSAKIDLSKLTHLSADHQQEPLEILDMFAECFSEIQVFVPAVNMSYQIIYFAQIKRSQC